MALQDPINQRDSEGLPRGRWVDSGGKLIDGVRRYFEKGRIQLGEIISGVNRNAQNIVQLETDYQDADGVISNAYIQADAVVAADAEASNAALQLAIETDYQAADALNAAAIAAETVARANAVSAEATARQTLEASITTSGNECFDSAFENIGINWANNFASGATATASVSTINDDRVFRKVMTGTPVSSSFVNMGHPNGASAPFSEYLRVRDGERVEAYCYAGGGGLSSIDVMLEWLDASGTFLSLTSLETDNSPAAGFGDHTSMRQLGGFADAPTGAFYAALVAKLVADGVTAGPTGVMTRPFMARARTNQTAYSPWTPGGARTAATTDVLRRAFVNSDGYAIAEIIEEAAAGGGLPTRLGIRNGSDGSSEIALVAKQIFFGNDTTFEDAHDTIYVERDGYRLRILGPFGTSSDLVLWYGADTVALNSETKTNGGFSIATDGIVRFGSAPANALNGVTLSSTFELGFTSASLGYSTTVTATANGGDGTYTYDWRRTAETGLDRVTATNTNTATPTFSVAAGGSSRDTWTVTLTETSTGRSYQASVVFDVSLV